MYLSTHRENGHFNERLMVEKERKRLQATRTFLKEETERLSSMNTETLSQEEKEKHTGYLQGMQRKMEDLETHKQAMSQLDSECEDIKKRLFDRANYLVLLSPEEVLERLRHSYAQANVFYQMLRADCLLNYESLLIYYATLKEDHAGALGESTIAAAAAFYGLQEDLLFAFIKNATFKEFIDEVESVGGGDRVALLVCEHPDIEDTVSYDKRKLFGANRYYDFMEPLRKLDKTSSDTYRTNYNRYRTAWQESKVYLPPSSDASLNNTGKRPSYTGILTTKDGENSHAIPSRPAFLQGWGETTHSNAMHPTPLAEYRDFVPDYKDHAHEFNADLPVCKERD